MMDEQVRQLFKEQIIRSFSEELHMDLLEEISDKELNIKILCSITRLARLIRCRFSVRS